MHEDLSSFELVSEFQPAGDQPKAIEELVAGIRNGQQFHNLLGVTGSGKTFTMANVIQQIGRPTLVVSHNKTLAAQLYEELKELFPNNSVNYFVSYYDYYQPEAYIPQRDIYIEKDASRNDNLDRLRLAATSALVSRDDVIIVASVSCIYGLGSPEEYKNKVAGVHLNEEIDRQEFLGQLADMQYVRADIEFQRGMFRVRGDVIEIRPAYEEFAYRIELFGDEVDSLSLIHPVSGEILAEQDKLFIYPAVHYVMPEERMEEAVANIKEEMKARVITLRNEGKLLEAHRIESRTKYDIEMIKEIGYCQGIENYSRHLDFRPAGSRPYTLLDYFPDNYLLIVDESHVTIPQFRAMFNGDQARKGVLVEHGFRLPSALDNRPLKFDEIEELYPPTVFVSATPGDYELEKTEGVVVEQIIRPTGLVDPPVEVRPATGQVEDIIAECVARAKNKERVLVNTLTKRLAEDLSVYLDERGIRVRYLHSEIDTIDRVEILKDLRKGEYDVLVGVNLLREGLDLPEVSLVCILDADKTGFLRSRTSMIQQMGRAARNADSTVVLYADQMTEAMQEAIEESERRRAIQLAYNEEHGITPKTIVKAIREGIQSELKGYQTAREVMDADDQEYDRLELMTMLEKDMLEAAEQLNFEKAAELRDRVKELKDMPEDSTVRNVQRKKAPKTKPGTPGTPVIKNRKYKKK